MKQRLKIFFGRNQKSKETSPIERAHRTKIKATRNNTAEKTAKNNHDKDEAKGMILRNVHKLKASDISKQTTDLGKELWKEVKKNYVQKRKLPT